MADWGADILSITNVDEGTVEAIVTAVGSRYLKTEVHYPLMQKLIAKYGILNNNFTAVMKCPRHQEWNF